MAPRGLRSALPNPWTQQNPATTPPAGNPGTGSLPCAYDELRARVVLVATGGQTWEWDGSDWLAAPAPGLPPLDGGSGMAFDRASNRMILTGGSGPSGTLFGFTWELIVRRPAGYFPLGFGCSGSAGVPNLTAAPYSLPWIGSTFFPVANNLVPGTAAALAVGAAQQPVDLSPLGMPGCWSFVSAPILLPAAAPLGVATWALPIALPPWWAGTQFGNQVFALDVTANPLGVTASNAAVGRLGLLR